ncbi:MAG: Helix-turn-helix domain [Chthoniobacter sp.]|jgi:transcriptional regulator with XRE-family HTH domain|nr:Helix-turn-helix domain [Chthoniobacter sp.]
MKPGKIRIKEQRTKALEKELAGNLRMLRKRANMRQCDAAAAAAIGKTTYQDYEVGRRGNMKLNTLVKLAEAFEVEPAMLLLARDELIDRLDRGSRTPQMEPDGTFKLYLRVSKSGVTEEDIPPDERPLAHRTATRAWLRDRTASGSILENDRSNRVPGLGGQTAWRLPNAIRAGLCKMIKAAALRLAGCGERTQPPDAC